MQRDGKLVRIDHQRVQTATKLKQGADAAAEEAPAGWKAADPSTTVTRERCSMVGETDWRQASPRVGSSVDGEKMQ
jgi:hypothetical protein